jgi:enoyl-CoA hydratase
MSYEWILIDKPRPWASRITLNRPEKRNALRNAMRGEIFDALIAADQDPEVRVSIIRGAGSCFSAGYDLKSDLMEDRPYYSAAGPGMWPRHLVDGYCRMWDLAKPVIAQVHGYCLAGGSELASGCDLVYVAEDAIIGYPAVRSISPPDTQVYPWLMGMRQAMEIMLTGDSITGLEAVKYGFANRAFKAEELDERVLERAERVAGIAPEVQQMNKRAVHRQMEVMGIRQGIRIGTELQALGQGTDTAKAFFETIGAKGLTAALSERDGVWGDYRTGAATEPEAK